MWIEGLRLAQFRQFESLSLALVPGLLFFHGDNAAGKTSLLEALSVLSRGRSFRSSQLGELARVPGDAAWQVDLRTAEVEALPDRWTARFEQRQLSIERNGEPTRVLDAARQLPLLCLLPTAHQVIDEAPAIRRGLLDWALFHVEPSFLEIWRTYQRTLRQRNEALKRGQRPEAIRSWTQLLAERGGALHALRAQLVDALRPLVAREMDALWPRLELELRLQSGWGDQTDLQTALEAQEEIDRRLRYTHRGPHRAELLLKVQDLPAKAVLSRGQQKMLVAAVHFALGGLLQSRLNQWPLLAVDDWNAELGPALAERFWERLTRYPGQRWITGFTPPGKEPNAVARLFHVEQGRVSGC
jgi:DNA replication and repair protein RecF